MVFYGVLNDFHLDFMEKSDRYINSAHTYTPVQLLNHR